MHQYIFFAWLGLLCCLSAADAWAIRYTGGSGRGEVMAGTVEISAASTVDQTFAGGCAATLMSPLTITQTASASNGIGAAGSTIEVLIPSALNMTWDSSVTTATLSGTASGYVSATVTYADSNKTLVLSVSTAFSDGNALTISGLKFKDFTSAGSGYLKVSIDGGSTVVAQDSYGKEITGGTSGTDVLFPMDF